MKCQSHNRSDANARNVEAGPGAEIAMHGFANRNDAPNMAA